LHFSVQTIDSTNQITRGGSGKKSFAIFGTAVAGLVAAALYLTSHKEEEEVQRRPSSLDDTKWGSSQNSHSVVNISPLSASTIRSILSVNENLIKLPGNGPVLEFHTNSYAANEPNEDRHAEMIGPYLSMFGIFDGHGGTAASEFCKQELLQYIYYEFYKKKESQKGKEMQHLKGLLPQQWTEVEKQLVDKQAIKQLRDQFDILRIIPTSMMRAFVVADDDFLVSRILQGGQKKFMEGYAGACALVACILDRILFVANAGDCRAVLAKKVLNPKGEFVWSAIQLSNDHTATTEEETIRAQHPNDPKAVSEGRIKGILEPSRSIGDGVFKEEFYHQSLRPEYRYPDPWEPPYVTSSPDVFATELGESTAFVVIASDGLWDKFTNEEVVQLLSQHNSQSENAATMLIKAALLKSAIDGQTQDEKLSSVMSLPKGLARGVHDDITVTVIFLNSNQDYWREKDLNKFPDLPDLQATIPETRKMVEKLLIEKQNNITKPE